MLATQETYKNVLPPGTILQLMYLKERLADFVPGYFIEIGPGSGEITSLLLKLGWQGCSYDLEAQTVERLKSRFTKEIAEGNYDAINADFFSLSITDNKADLIISCMVMEHFDDALESRFMTKAKELLSCDGVMIGIVPGSPSHWGIEDDIAGHCRRYTREALYSLNSENSWTVEHIAGLTYPISNILLPFSNFLVQRKEGFKTSMSDLDKTKASGIRNVRYKTHFPDFLAMILNPRVLLPLYWLQKLFRRSEGSLVLYFEARPSRSYGENT